MPEFSIKVIDAKVTDHFMMLITFSTGEKRVFDASILTGNAFEPLNDIDAFKNFKIVHGVITWLNEDIDCSPEYMYKHSYAYAKGTAEEHADNAFCEALYQDYMNSSDKNESYSLDGCKKKWGID